MNKENKPCPFCDNQYVEVKRNPRWNDWHVYCDICFACGPSASTPEEAWAKWNKRNNSFTQCEYFPCHKDIENFDCTFCYCPLYVFPDCGGNYATLPSGVKDCSGCTRPHKLENRQEIIDTLIRLMKGEVNNAQRPDGKRS